MRLAAITQLGEDRERLIFKRVMPPDDSDMRGQVVEVGSVL
jgi:hypothetical protein